MTRSRVTRGASDADRDRSGEQQQLAGTHGQVADGLEGDGGQRQGGAGAQHAAGRLGEADSDRPGLVGPGHGQQDQPEGREQRVP